MTKETEVIELTEAQPERKPLTVVVTLDTKGELHVESNIAPLGSLHLLNEASATLIVELSKQTQAEQE